MIELFLYFILFRIIEHFSLLIIKNYFLNKFINKKNEINSHIIQTEIKPPLNNELPSFKKKKKKNQIISNENSIVLPLNFDNLHIMDKTKFIMLYSVDVLFETITPLLKKIIKE